jgi:hypothetical protein
MDHPAYSLLHLLHLDFGWFFLLAQRLICIMAVLHFAAVQSPATLVQQSAADLQQHRAADKSPAFLTNAAKTASAATAAVVWSNYYESVAGSITTTT